LGVIVFLFGEDNTLSDELKILTFRTGLFEVNKIYWFLFTKLRGVITSERLRINFKELCLLKGLGFKNLISGYFASLLLNFS